MPSPTEYDLDVQINGVSIPFDGFTFTSGAFASVGHGRISTGQTAMRQGGIDLLQLVENAASLVEVGIWVQPAGQARTRIFGGEYLEADWSFDHDMVTIKCRDWAGLLVDQKRVLAKVGAAIVKAVAPDVVGRVSAAGISNQNQQVSQIVTAIAKEFGFNPVLNLDSSNNPTIGALYGSSDHVFMTVPQSLWSVLCQLARDTGYDVYVTPNKDLVFGLPGAGQDTLKVCHNLDTLPYGVVPIRDLTIKHSPRRNSTFRVMVISHDPARAQLTLGQAVAVGANYAGGGLSAGITSGSGAAAASAALAKAKVNVKQVPLYTFHLDGLTADQANRQAAALAQRISRRELILSGEIDIDPVMLPTRQVALQGSDVENEFTGDTFFVSGYTHEFVMPKGEGADRRAGLSTQIRALNLPTQALAAETSG